MKNSREYERLMSAGLFPRHQPSLGETQVFVNGVEYDAHGEDFPR
jgi:hypothetical protein